MCFRLLFELENMKLYHTTTDLQWKLNHHVLSGSRRPSRMNLFEAGKEEVNETITKTSLCPS